MNNTAQLIYIFQPFQTGENHHKKGGKHDCFSPSKDYFFPKTDRL